MKNFAMSIGLLFAAAVSADPTASAALTASAAATASAELIGQTVNSSFASGPILVCEYVGSGIQYEIVAQTGRCAARLNGDPSSSPDQRLATLLPDAK